MTKTRPQKTSVKPTKKARSQKASSVPEVPAEKMLTQALMTLVAERGFAGLSLEDVAETAGLSLAETRVVASSLIDILALYGQEVDTQMTLGSSPEGELKDQLFDLIMRRFDALAEYREAVLVLVNEATLSPSLALRLLPLAKRGVVSTLAAVDIAPTPLRVMGLGAVMLAALRTYLTDESEDLGKTMSSLDVGLSRLQAAANALSPLLKAA